MIHHIQVIREKTKLLNEITALTAKKLELSESLLPKQTKQYTRTVNDVSEYKVELFQIAQVAKEQSKRIEGLKVELFMLKRKDTSSLTMPALALPSPPKPMPLFATQPTKESSIRKKKATGSGRAHSLTPPPGTSVSAGPSQQGLHGSITDSDMGSLTLPPIANRNSFSKDK